ncbi:Uncharacterised protein [Chlamydia trachomatis]|nr:Uncharacterised protein [Chlamydia trachomatis]
MMICAWVSEPMTGSEPASPSAESRVPAMAFDWTEVMTNAQVTTVMTAKTEASTLFFIPSEM